MYDVAQLLNKKITITGLRERYTIIIPRSQIYPNLSLHQ